MKTITFVLSDQSLNNKGFRVLTSGADLQQFQKNPVMLYCHDGRMLPIGTWQNIRTEGDRLLADAVFDLDDPFAAQVARKVEKGIIRCCSIGFDIIEVSTDPNLMLPGQPLPTVTRWRLMECSICAIGANPAAMKLKAGQHMTLSREINIQNLQTKPGPLSPQNTQGAQNNQTIINQNSNTMAEKTENQELAQLRQELADERQKNQTLTQERDTLRTAAQQARDNEISGLLSAAVADGRITEAARPQWDKLLHADLDNGKAALAALAPRASLSQTLKENGGKSEFAGKSWNELDRAGRLAAYKEQDPEGFRTLYKQTFGADWRD